jgi:hypothetical protein
MKRTYSLVFTSLLLVNGLVTPGYGEDLSGVLSIGEGLEVFLTPQPGFFTRIFAAIGLSSPPIPVSLTAAAVLGRDSVVVAEMDEDWGIYARVHPSEGEEKWYAIGRPSTRFWDMRLRSGVSISRVKKNANQIFEGAVEGDPWFLTVKSPDKLVLEEDAHPVPVGMKFWLNEYIYSYDEASHSSAGLKKKDNFRVLKEAIVSGLPDELDMYAEDPVPYERFKQLGEFVKRAGEEDLVPLRDLLEAKVERLEQAPIEIPEARDEAVKRYEEILENLRRRTLDE